MKRAACAEVDHRNAVLVEWTFASASSCACAKRMEELALHAHATALANVRACCNPVGNTPATLACEEVRPELAETTVADDAYDLALTRLTASGTIAVQPFQ